MLHPNAQLNHKIFDEDVEQVPLRNGFGEGLVQAADEDPRVVGLCADLLDSTRMNAFAEKYPERYVEIGVAEQNLASVASGMAAAGKVPFITSYAMFSPGRNWEQIRTTICYNNRPVKVVGSHAGVSVGPDGGTHQAIEDIAIMRVIPRMVVLTPCDAVEAKKATLAAAKTDTPVYIRLAREKTPIMTTQETPFEIGRAQKFYESFPERGGDRVGIIASGPLLHKALVVAEKLAREEIAVSVLNLATIKPMDEAGVEAFARNTNGIVTVEEHQIHGGMGSAVAELLVRRHPIPMEFIGVKDEFGQSGTPEELIEYYGMGEDAIKKAVLKINEKI